MNKHFLAGFAPAWGRGVPSYEVWHQVYEAILMTHVGVTWEANLVHPVASSWARMHRATRSDAHNVAA